MSLAPAERRALNTIEDALCRSDPRLARMLARFKLPLSRGGLVIFLRRPRPLRQLIVSAVAVTAAVLVVVGIVRSPAPPRCSAPESSVLIAAAAAARHCSLLMHEGRAISTTGTGTAGAPGDQPGP
jgi:DUF3040 family protein